jgi:two-component system nitrogen regulation sensor histidine kinase NtrY
VTNHQTIQKPPADGGGAFDRDPPRRPRKGVLRALRPLAQLAGRRGVEQVLMICLAALAILTGLATYVAGSGNSPYEADGGLLLPLLYINLVMVLVFSAVVARRLAEVWVQRRRGLAGSRLHIRLVVLFSTVAVIPTIIVSLFAYAFLNIGMESWFSDKVRTALNESRAVAQAYLAEHEQSIRADALAVAADFNRNGFQLINNRAIMDGFLDAEVATRQLTEAVVFNEKGHEILGRSTFSFALEFEPIPESAMQLARSGEVAIITSENENRVRALVRIDQLPGVMLYVGRPVEPRVIDHLKKTDAAVEQYERLERERGEFQIKFVLIFGGAAVLLLLVAVWVGLNFATGISRRISGLVVAAEKVRGGDLSARVAELDENDEFGSLGRAFNRMTDEIGNQQNELVEANRQLDYRRRFTEAVLSGVSAGVTGLDEHGVVTLPNRSAAQLLGLDFDQLLGRYLGDVVPEMTPLLEEAFANFRARVESQIKILANNRATTLLVRITAESGQGEIRGYVVTFDDITELVAAQRKAAWADVARRIAHEMKNPLTPIQLSAERLKRKYLGEIKSDPETFSLCTDTIIRQVGDIGRMVDEFSSFARMPAPVLREESMTDIARQAVFLQRTAHGDIDFNLEFPPEPVVARCDSRQISQALINLLQNSIDAIHGRIAGADAALQPGRIDVSLTSDQTQIILSVADNGKGLPKEGRETLTEPYVTTRTKGTGLGLAIVKKIMEDHAGALVLEDSATGGARVSLVFPKDFKTSLPRDQTRLNDTVEKREALFHGS